MRTYLRLALVVGGLFVGASCDPYKVAGVYCDTDDECASNNCYKQYHACVPADFGYADMAMCAATSCDLGDAGPMCMSNCDAGADAGDMQMPDLMPACTVGTVATACTDSANP